MGVKEKKRRFIGRSGYQTCQGSRRAKSVQAWLCTGTQGRLSAKYLAVPLAAHLPQNTEAWRLAENDRVQQRAGLRGSSRMGLLALHQCGRCLRRPSAYQVLGGYGSRNKNGRGE